MSFLKSAINQVGRDLGKVVSNKIFNDSHSSPYRRVSSNHTSKISKEKVIDIPLNFNKTINFQTGFKPDTLLRKISAVYIVIKNEANKFLSDGYLDSEESSKLFEMVSLFNQKVEDICDILEIDEEKNFKELKNLSIIVEKTDLLLKDIFTKSAEGCKVRQKENILKAENIEKKNTLRHILLHIFWMGKYANGNKLSLVKTLLANLIDIVTFTFPFTRIYLLIKGLISLKTQNNRLDDLKKAYLKLAELDGKRAEYYLNI